VRYRRAQVVAEGAIAAIRAGHNIYTRMDGIARLRRAIAAQVERLHGIALDPEREVVVTSGASGAYHATAMALLIPATRCCCLSRCMATTRAR